MEPDTKLGTPEDTLLKEIRDTYDYYTDAWREIKESGKEDILYLSGDPWTSDERTEREDSGRFCMAFDELTQYCNQIINDVRMNKRSIKVTPVSEDANDKTAEGRERLIRGIEYESNAQTAYVTAFEGAVQRGYGFARVTSEYVPRSFNNQVIRIKRIPNPDTVLMDPDCKEADCSDAMGCFVIDVLTKKEFKRRYPKAKQQSFNADDMKLAPKWIKPDSIVVAEFWKAKKKPRTLVLLDEQSGETQYLDEIKGAKLEKEGDQEFLSLGENRIPVKTREDDTCRELCQYITNGVEILETNPQSQKVRYIPIIPCFGKEMFVDEGGGAKRILMSLIRLARDPFKYLCFLVSQEAEEAAMTPRVPWQAYEGQLEGHEDEWKNAHKVPITVLYAKPLLDATGNNVLPLPTRPQFQPNFQSYELAKESAKRSIQAACGMYNSAVGKHDSTVKSGVQQKALDTQSAQGNFHFVDNYDRFLQHMGRVIDERIPVYYDTARQVGMRKSDDAHQMAVINNPQYQAEQGKDPLPTYDLTTGQHDVTVGVGPSFESQREAADAYLQQLVANLATLPFDPAIKSKMLALAIRMQQLGPLGDAMADLLDPKEMAELPPQAQQMLSKMQQQIQALNAYAQQIEAEKKKLEMEKQAKIVDNQFRLEVEKMKAETSVTIAEINTKAQEVQTRMQFEQDMWKTIHGSAHDAGMQADSQLHQSQEAEAQRQAAAESQATQQGHEADMAAQAQAAQEQQGAQQ